MTPPRLVAGLICAGIAVRGALAVWNVWAGPVFGADADAVNFHRFATGIAGGEVRPGTPLITFAFAYLLGLVYRVTGPSILVGSLISCAVWALSAVVLQRAMSGLDVRRESQARAMLVYALLPTSVIWTSATLREPYQLLCVNLIMYAALRILAGAEGRDWILLVLATCAGALLHAAVLVLGGVVIFVLIAVALWRDRTSRIATAARAALAVAVLAAAGASFAAAYAPYIDGGVATAVGNFIETGLLQPARTAYVQPHTLNIVGVLDLAWFVVTAFWRYLFEPMPWRVSTWMDFGLFLENVLRGVLIGCGVLAVVRSHGATRLRAVLLLTFYAVLEGIWSVGTFNWGTAARHHIPAMGLLLAAAALYRSGRPTGRQPQALT